MNGHRQPDQSARLLAHALVGIGVGYFLGKQKGLPGFITGLIVSTAVHEAMDAPVAQVLSDLGA
jgi:RsiW-degrading membrane proteinase PrsW (M82 family)